MVVEYIGNMLAGEMLLVVFCIKLAIHVMRDIYGGFANCGMY